MALRTPPPGSRSVGEIAHSSGTSAIVFMLFVAAGSAYIIVAKLQSVQQIYVTFVPVFIMVSYALLIWLARSLRLRDDQAGDNLYYMGFLFTLTSLGVSLYQFNANRAAEEIVQNFGIAIGSTITGIALRVIFNQMRQDPIEVERTMRLELADAARRVRRELDSTVVEFGHVRRSAQQAAEDSFSHMTARIDEIASRLLAGIADVAAKSALPLEDASRRSAETIAEASNTMVTALTATARQLAAEIERLSNSVAEISATIGEVTTKLDKVRLPDGIVEVSLGPAIETLTDAVNRFSTQSDRQAATIHHAIEATKGAAEGSSTSIAALREDTEANAVASRAALKAARDSSDAMTHILDQFNADAWDQVELLRALLERTDDAFRTFAETAAQSRADLAAQTQSFRDMLLAIHASAETLAMATERLADVAEDLGGRRIMPQREAIR